MKFQAAAIAALAGLMVTNTDSVHAQNAAVNAKPMVLSAMDYIEIEQLYANYTHALDRGESERFASTFVLDREFTGRGGEVLSPIKGKDALLQMGRMAGTAPD